MVIVRISCTPLFTSICSCRRCSIGSLCRRLFGRTWKRGRTKLNQINCPRPLKSTLLLRQFHGGKPGGKPGNEGAASPNDERRGSNHQATADLIDFVDIKHSHFIHFRYPYLEEIAQIA